MKTINDMIKEGKTKNFKTIDELLSLVRVDNIIKLCYYNIVNTKEVKEYGLIG